MREKLTKAKKAGAKPEANGKKKAAPVESDEDEDDSDEEGLDAVSWHVAWFWKDYLTFVQLQSDLQAGEDDDEEGSDEEEDDSGKTV